jgi:endonuclease/exonuclease/phosphatase family metal-dependent hydrolase
MNGMFRTLQRGPQDRRGWLGISGRLLLLLLAGAGLRPLAAADPPRVRVLTYNIHHGEGADGKVDLPRLAAVISRCAPDVVALQEVDVGTRRAHGVDQAAELGRLTGLHAVFGQAMDVDGGQYGEALLSRWPLEAVEVHALPCDEQSEPRCVVAARVVPPDRPAFVFAGTHLEHARAPLRLCQAGKVSSKLAPAPAPRVIVAGDFNDTPPSPTLLVLRRHWTDASDGQWQPTWPAHEPRDTLDYVLYRPATAWRVVEVQVIQEPIASDHRPLLAVLEMLTTP